ncbi:MAG: phosphoribosylformylglycinamidine synthase [Bdellovibrionales bacterium]|nr:phosphoribosylformylglycinamidine synthase [Bdellovibrionales bacterium]
MSGQLETNALRIELFPRTRDLDVTAKRLTEDFLRENPGLSPNAFRIETAKAYVIDRASEATGAEALREAAEEILVNAVLDRTDESEAWAAPAGTRTLFVERRFRPGMTDNAARTLEEALAIRLGVATENSGLLAHRLDLYRIDAESAELRAALAAFVAHPLLHRTFTFDGETWANRAAVTAGVSTASAPTSMVGPIVRTFAIRNLDEAALERASKENLWALTRAEMLAIREHFRALDREPRIGEMEVLAQTWSEHCKHKIFRGTIAYRETGAEGPVATVGGASPTIPAETKNLFKTTIKAATDASPKPWLLSVFSDNAGIVAFTAKDAVCIKVETHNSPSAIDPFAGAITGIGGVHRDIIGTGFGAKPIFNLDVFCVAPARFDVDRPDGIFPPSRILEGVRAGVEAGGNPAGIPTVAGALVYDASYLGKPLVFCGSGGVLPRELAKHPLRDCAAKSIEAGDAIVMVGGRIGRDGIHGATFSSLALDSSDASMSNATVVQLGDPFTQKRALDFLLVARDRGLYRTLTDNGAGGLSSSVGELATLSNGARLDLTDAPLKATDLRPEEILVSESQERMSVAVPRSSLPDFLALSKTMGVESTALGEFTANGRFEVLYRGETIADLDLGFLHDGCPELKLEATWSPTKPAPFPAGAKTPKVGEALLALLGSENIASKESLLRQYDHEVQGTSLVKPQTQIGDHRSPNQSAAVLVGEPTVAGQTAAGEVVAAVVGVGILPEYSRYDAYTMAQASLDEAVRNVLATGAEFGGPDAVMALLDNFCWPDPVSNPKYAADLVRAGYGLRDAATALELPFVSGKDSMKNDFRGKQNGRDVKISVLPTVLVTALGRIGDLTRARSSEFKQAGDAVFLLGPHRFSLLGSQFERIGLAHPDPRGLPPADWAAAKRLYAWLGSDRSTRLRSCADVAEGGTLTAIAEGLFAYELGFEVDAAWATEANLTDYFGEGMHSFVVSIGPEHEVDLVREWFAAGIAFTKLGRVTENAELKLPKETIPTAVLESAWRKRP